MTRRCALQSLAISAVAPLLVRAQPPAFYTFSVLSLLRPRELHVAGCGPARLHCDSGGGRAILEPGVVLTVNAARTPFTLTGPNGAPASYALIVPGVIRRCYFGLLSISASDGVLTPVVTMDRETAVRSIVGAELPVANAPLNALAAQAVAARSYLAATLVPRHPGADFCDTTHCQFLRAPALRGSSAARAVDITAPLVLACVSSAFPALYSAACGGATLDLRTERYHYSPVACEICRGAHLLRRGDGFGLCQEGALGLARLGWSWRAILAKYYPASSLLEV